MSNWEQAFECANLHPPRPRSDRHPRCGGASHLHPRRAAGGGGRGGAFRGWLETQGFPVGIVWAWGVTVCELVAPGLIILRRWVGGLCLGHVGTLTLGMVHLPNGLFVVRLGRNWMDYSVLLIECLLALAFVYRGDLKKANGRKSDE